MELLNAQQQFCNLLQSLSSPALRDSFLQWIEANYPSMDEGKDAAAEADSKLEAIAKDLRETMQPYGMLPSENILVPASCDVAHTIHVDAFMYDELTLDRLFESGHLAKFYCTNCGSRNIRPLTLISHSMSQERLSFIFQSLLPPLQNHTVVDVGSRVGAVLYGAYYYSSAARILGIEMNKSFCEIQSNVVQKYNLGDRIRVMHGDLLQYSEILQSADVVFLHNVFEYFLSKDDEMQCWRFLQANVRKPKALIVAIPDLTEMLGKLKMDVDGILSSWVERLPLDGITSDTQHSELAQISMYQVL